MSFSKIFNNKTIYCLRNGYKFQNNLKFNSNNSFSLNIKTFHSLNSFPKKDPLFGLKPHVNTNTSHRCLSSVKTDTTIDFKPEVILQTTDEKVIDLSGGIYADIGGTLTDISTLPLTELGLASNWTPIGWVLHLLDGLHSVLPWYATIAVATIILRITIFPLVIKAQRNAMKMNMVMPKLQELQQKSTNARLSGNQMEFAKYVNEQQMLFKANGISPLKNFLVPLAQAPIFISFFLTLRRMAQLPVPSLTTGGILWFVDLTVSDPFHILPIITAVSLWATLELGLESGVSVNQSAIVRTMMRVLPVITLIFIWNFESIILMYWCTSNLVSLLQVALLKQNMIREFLNIPIHVKHKSSDLPKSTKGFVESIRESMDNSKVYKKLEDRKRIDEINFKKAAIGPLKRTYKTDPTKVQNKN